MTACLTLYQFATSPFTDKVRRALNFKGIDFEVHEVDRPKARAGGYATVSASGKFPAIEHEGTIVQDSTDILDYLETRFPTPKLLPDGPRDRAICHVIEDWADESLYFYEMTMRLTWAHNLDGSIDQFMGGFPGLSREQASATIMERVGAITRTQGLGRKPVAAVLRDVERHLTALDRLIGPEGWLVGGATTRADLAVRAQVEALRGACEVRESLGAYPRVRDWLARVDQVAPFTLSTENPR